LISCSTIKEYDDAFNKQIRDGIIERVSPQEQSSECHFLLHHAVFREEKSAIKLRIVFDRSAKNDLSINDCLEKGPNTTPHILNILLKFRWYQIGIVPNIEKGFHQ